VKVTRHRQLHGHIMHAWRGARRAQPTLLLAANPLVRRTAAESAPEIVATLPALRAHPAVNLGQLRVPRRPRPIGGDANTGQVPIARPAIIQHMPTVPASDDEISESTRRVLSGLFQSLPTWTAELAAGRPSPEPASDFSLDESVLGSYSGWYLAVTHYAVAVEYLQTVNWVLDLPQIHLAPPIGLLRGALECAAAAAWLVAPDDAAQRRHRALRMWCRDLDDRATYEAMTSWQPPNARSKTAVKRRAEVKGLAAKEVNNAAASNAQMRVTTTTIIGDMGVATGSSRAVLDRLWSLSSGLAHGRYWPAIVGDLDLADERISPETGVVTRSYTAPDKLLEDLAINAHRFAVMARRLLKERAGSAS
jgi:hypothetical protein